MSIPRKILSDTFTLILRTRVGADFWNDSGCSTIHFENGSVMCSCNHLSHFGVLIPGPDTVHDYNNYKYTSALHMPTIGLGTMIIMKKMT